MRKEKLQEAIAETRRREAELEALSTDEPADPSGKWHPKDHLAHVAWNREREARFIDAARTGGDLPAKIEDDGDTHNRKIYEETRDMTSAEVIALARRSWDALEAAIEACSDEDFDRPRPYEEKRKLVEGSPADHLAAHIFWCHIEAGHEKEALDILSWAQDLSARTSTDPRTRAVATYNLACFYARTGRAEEAARLLQEALESAPDLREWSHKDPDLDPIRDDPRVAEVLGVKV